MTPFAAQPMSPDPRIRARRGLTYLEQELLAQERGEEPDLGRVIGILRAVRGALLRAEAGRAAELCVALRRYLEELREDTGGFSLEDVDVTLGAVERMRRLLEDERAVDHWMDGLTPAGSTPLPSVVGELVYAPEFRESGLYWEIRDGTVQLGFPALESETDANALIEDLRVLWDQLSGEQSWTLRPGNLERLRVSLLSALIRLSRGAAAPARRVQLLGSAGELQSPALNESLGRCFAMA